MYILNKNCLPNAVENSSSTRCNSLKETVAGWGAIQRNRWQRPFSTFAWISMRFRATTGCVKPPMVKPVCFIVKFASPDTADGTKDQSHLEQAILIDSCNTVTHLSYGSMHLLHIVEGKGPAHDSQTTHDP